MKFGPVPVGQAAGAILAHSVALRQGRLRKGVMLEVAHLEALARAGHDSVVVAQLEPGDLHEDAAAQELATSVIENQNGIHLTQPFTGRVNLIADHPGVVRLDPGALHAANSVHPMITVATVPNWQQMAAGQMVATVKIIAYGVPGSAVAQAADLARGSVSLVAPVHKTASLIITEISAGSGAKGMQAIVARVAALEMELRETLICSHEEGALMQAIVQARGNVILILTGSATSDIYDTAPEALRRAGGQVERFGMPVDPGNLLFIGRLGHVPVIGLPGCARSPALNGTDWVLSRVACGIEVTDADIARMGVGGLLKEIPTRPMPRRGKPDRS